MGPNDCDDMVAIQDDMPVIVCRDDVPVYVCELKVILHCCTNHILCHGIRWSYEWWYKDATESNSTFKRYPGAESETLWVYVNNTGYPIRYLCNISTSSHECDEGSGYIDLQRGS